MPLILEAHLQFLLSPSLSVLAVDDSINELLGCHAEDLRSGKINFTDRVHDHDSDIVQQLFSLKSVPDSGTTNLRLRHIDGHICCVKVTFNKQQGKQQREIILDLLLQEAKSLYVRTKSDLPSLDALLENTDDYICFKDCNHVVTGANKTFALVTKGTEHWHDLLGLTDYDIFPESYADIYYNLGKQIFSGIPIAHEQHETLDIHGNTGWVDNRKYPIHNHNGEIIGLFGVARDITEQKKLEIQLKQSEARLKEAQRYAHIAHWDLLADQKTAIWSEHAYEILGLPIKSTTTPEALCQVLHQDDCERVMHSFQHSLKSGDEHHVEYRITRQNDGQKRWIECRGRCIFNDDGSLERLSGFIHDITERKQAELLLKQNEQRLRLSQKYGGIGTWEYSFISDKVVCSEVVFERLNFPLPSQGASWDDFFKIIYPQDRSLVEKAAQQHIKHGKVLDVEFRIIDSYEKIRWLRAIGQAEFDSEHIPVKLLGTVQDITRRRVGQLEIEKLLAKQSAIIDNQSLVGIVIVHQRKIIWANSAYEKMLGYNKNEIIGSPTRQLYKNEEDYQTIGAAYKNIKTTGIVEDEMQFIHKDGTAVWLSLRGSQLDEQSGESLWIFIDITKQKQKDIALSQALKNYHSLFEGGNDAILVLGNAKFVNANQAALDLFGCSNIDMLHELTPADLSPPTQPWGGNSQKLMKQHIAAAIKEGRHQFEWMHKRIDTDKSFLADVLLSTNTINEQVVLQATVRDISQQKKYEFSDKLHHQVLELLIQSEPLTTIFTSIIVLIEQANPSMICSILLMDAEEKHLVIGAAPSLPDFYNDAVNGITVGEGIGSCASAAYTKQRIIVEDIQNHPYWEPYTKLAAKANLASCWSEPIIGSTGNVLGTFAIYHRKINAPEQQDIELITLAARLAGLAIEKNEAYERLLLSSRVFLNTHEAITITDADERIIEVNPAFCEITGYSREEVIGKNPRILSSGKQPPQFYKAMWQQINDQGFWQGEIWNRKKNGELCAELLAISVIRNHDNEVTHYIGLFSDITQSKQQQEKLNLMAHYDVLTGLPNRTLFVDRFNQSLAHSDRTKHQLAVCFLDLDNFKPVNDQYGHETGDQLLIEVAKRITGTIREEDTVSRQGGDEFALLLNDIDCYEHCEQTLERLHRVLAKPFIINGQTHNISASSGFTLYPDDEGDVDTLLRHADQAMYNAKQSGRNQYQLFNTQHYQQVTLKRDRLNEIEQALINDEFQLYYQPKVNMTTGAVFGVEALIRWIHPEKGLIPPLDFLPVIDGTELEKEIGDWVINEALSQLEIWHQQGLKTQVSVNISSYHLLSETFLSQLEESLKQHPKIDPKCLQLEILESSALGDLNAINSIIKTCQNNLGLTLALDDFGTGYSSLTHLRNLPANTIKIDQSFVRDLLDDPDDASIIDGVIGLANAFNRTVIAEGVETTAHGLMLLIMGCNEAQGYGISKPMPANKFPQWLKNYQPNQDWLEYAQKPHTIKENKRKLFRLAAAHWKNKFVGNIHAKPEQIEHWPIMNSHRDHCGIWINRAKQERLFNLKDLDKLQQSHEKFHKIANLLLQQYQQGEIDAAQEGLTELEAAYESISNAIGMCD